MLLPLLRGQPVSEDGALASEELVEVIQRLVEQVEANGVGFDVAQATRVVLSTYGDTVSVEQKSKNLTKFGRNLSVGSTFETVAEFQGATANETFATTNSVDSAASSSASDTQTVTIEGHTIDGSGNLAFAVQSVTLTGQTPVSLPTPLARATRVYVENSGVFNTTPPAMVGTLYVYDSAASGGVTSGVPNTAAATKIIVSPGQTQSEKCATATSSQDYWFISRLSVGIGNAGGSADRITTRIQVRDVANGGAWRPVGEDLVITVGQGGRTREFSPYVIVPKSHDIRVIAKTNANTAEVSGALQGYLAVVVG